MGDDADLAALSGSAGTVRDVHGCPGGVTCPARPSTHVPAAVDVDGLAGDVAICGQHDDDRCDLACVAEAADRNQRRRDGRIAFQHLRFNQRRSDRV